MDHTWWFIEMTGGWQQKSCCSLWRLMHESTWVITNIYSIVVIALKLALSFQDFGQKTVLDKIFPHTIPTNVGTKASPTFSHTPYICTNCVHIHFSTNVRNYIAQQTWTNVATSVQRHFSTFAQKHAGVPKPTNVVKWKVATFVRLERRDRCYKMLCDGGARRRTAFGMWPRPFSSIGNEFRTRCLAVAATCAGAGTVSANHGGGCGGQQAAAAVDKKCQVSAICCSLQLHICRDQQDLRLTNGQQM